MKKVLSILGALAVIGSASCFGAAGVNLTNWDTEKPVFYLTSGTVAGAGTYVEVYGGADAASLKPLAPAGGSSVFELADGMFDGGYATVDGVADNGNAVFVAYAWKGNGVSGGWASAAEMGKAEWNQATGTIAPLPAAPTPAAMQFPAGVTITTAVIPEPTTIALGLIGAAGLLFFRRK